MSSYDVLVIGSGPAGEKAAVQSAKLGKKVAIIERRPLLGGAGLQTGTLPSKTLREAALFIAGLKQRAILGVHGNLSRDITLGELMLRKSDVIKKQTEVLIDQLSRNDIEIIHGDASFFDAHTLVVNKPGGEVDRLAAEKIIIAPGTRPARPEAITFDADSIHDSDSILDIKKLPSSVTVIGGGVIGCEYACVFAALGVSVTLVEKRPKLLSFADREVVASLAYWMRHEGITIRTSEEVVAIEVEEGRVVTRLKSSKVINSEILLYTMGRVGNTDTLGLEVLGIAPDKRGLLKVNDVFQTEFEHIYAVGDVIGFPSLASTSREQGRRAVCHAFGSADGSCDIAGPLPVGVYTIPEISMIGATEEELTEQGVPYEVGSAFFSEVARGIITGDLYGMLKIIFHRDTRVILGVHIVGERASELIHIGGAVMNYGGTIDYFKDVVFNYPTLSDAYKQAAHNGLNKL